MGGKSISRAKKSHDFRDLTAAKRKRTRWSRHEANENLWLVDFLTSEGMVNFPPSDFLESLLLRRWQ